MPLKTVEKVTISVPITVMKNLKSVIPKNKRSNYISGLINKDLELRLKKIVSLESTQQYWENFRKKYDVKPLPKGNTIVDLIREDRDSH